MYYIAISLPENIRQEFIRYQRKWQEIPCSWVEPKNLIVILSFLGKISKENLEKTINYIKPVLSNISPFEISFKSIDFFPAFDREDLWQKNKILPLFIISKNDEQNQSLISLNSRLKYIGIEGKIQSPRLVLGRIKKLEFSGLDPTEIPDIKEDIDLQFTVKSIDIIEVKVNRGKAKHTIIETCSLDI